MQVWAIQLVAKKKVWAKQLMAKIKTYFFATSCFDSNALLSPAVLPRLHFCHHLLCPYLVLYTIHKMLDACIHNFRVPSLNNHNKYWLKFPFNELVTTTLIGQPLLYRVCQRSEYCIRQIQFMLSSHSGFGLNSLTECNRITSFGEEIQIRECSLVSSAGSKGEQQVVDGGNP